MGIGLRRDALQPARQRGADQRAGMGDRYAFARAVAPAAPARVDQPALGAVADDLLPQHSGIDGRMTRHEGGAEAGGEGRLRLGHPLRSEERSAGHERASTWSYRWATYQ